MSLQETQRKEGRVNPVSRVFTKQSILVFLDTYEGGKKKGGGGQTPRILWRVTVIVKKKDLGKTVFTVRLPSLLWTLFFKPDSQNFFRTF